MQQKSNAMHSALLNTYLSRLFRRNRTCVWHRQCDQMARLLIQYLAIWNNGNMPIAKNEPKQVKNFDKYKINSQQKWPKTIKFCQIWSHWTLGKQNLAANTLRKGKVDNGKTRQKVGGCFRQKVLLRNY